MHLAPAVGSELMMGGGRGLILRGGVLRGCNLGGGVNGCLVCVQEAVWEWFKNWFSKPRRCFLNRHSLHRLSINYHDLWEFTNIKPLFETKIFYFRKHNFLDIIIFQCKKIPLPLPGEKNVSNIELIMHESTWGLLTFLQTHPSLPRTPP